MDDGVLETINLAIKSQEEIKSQLLAEIAQLESQHELQKGETAPIKFYKSSIEHLRAEKQSLNDKIHQFKQVEYPTLQQKLQRMQQKNAAIENRISYLEKIRDEDIVSKLSSPEAAQEIIKQFSDNLKAEIAELTKEEDAITKKISESKDELHQLQELNLSTRREHAKSTWALEINEEAKLNVVTKTKKRKRSSTYQNRHSAFLPPDPLAFSPYF